jgi:hypothetical protein
MRLLLLLFLLAPTALLAQRPRYMNDTSFTATRTRDWQPDRREGKCRIRVVVDHEADIELRGDTIYIHVIRGGPGRDQNPPTECNAPLPRGGITGFNFRGIDGRGQVRLVQEPRASNRWSAIVNIVDDKGGEEGYTFDLSWRWDGSGGNPGRGPGRDPGNRGDADGSFFPGRGDGGRQDGRGGRGGGFFPGGGDEGLGEIDSTFDGSGAFDDAGARTRIVRLGVRVSGNRCTLALVDARNNRAEFEGVVVRQGGGSAEIELNRSTNGRVQGRASLNYVNDNVTNITMDGQLNGRRFTASWSR